MNVMARIPERIRSVVLIGSTIIGIPGGFALLYGKCDSDDKMITVVEREMLIEGNRAAYGTAPNNSLPLTREQHNFTIGMPCGVRVYASDYNNDGRLERTVAEVIDFKKLHECYRQIRP